MNFQADLRQGPNNFIRYSTTLKAFGKVKPAGNGQNQGLLITDDNGNEQWFGWFLGPSDSAFVFKDKGRPITLDLWMKDQYFNCQPVQANQHNPQQPGTASQAVRQGFNQPQAPPQQPPQGYQDGPQGYASSPPPQAAPPQNVQQSEPQRNMTYAYEVTPEVAARIARSVALEAASRIMIGKSDIKPMDVIDMAMRFWDWVATGKIPMTPAPEPGREPGEDPEPETEPDPAF